MITVKAKIHSKAEHASMPGHVYVTFELAPNNVGGFYLTTEAASKLVCGADVYVHVGSVIELAP